MKQSMNRAERRKVNRAAMKNGTNSKQVLDNIVNNVQDKIVQAVKEVDRVALLYILNERATLTTDQIDSIYFEFNKAIDDLNSGVLDYSSIKSMYYEED